VVAELGFFGHGDRLLFGLGDLLVPDRGRRAGEGVVVQVL